ncbi:MAG TPA: energy-coupling factor ABC transporter permease [Candidatus Pseudomonas excrementavium]|uniref:energy-coupling factor ABC transporter permease n=1 Tax=Halopseudomonas bauzanensis TaxID=653930 RepID=UPI001C3981B8|nr:energy-coupling factor ABC transporter permease [Halopseudomonas bauzanensis]HIZ51425.1 energy-coupling factor ABC transporter permease [Candidatus Pseudomonas excrementavium]
MLSASLLTTTQIILSLLLYGGTLLWALARISWVELVADSRRQHLFYGSVFALFVLWLLRKEFDNGLTFHFLGLTVVTLMLDWPLALVAGTLAQLAMVALGLDDAVALGANGLLRILIPVLVTVAASRFLERFKPSNLFLYIFISGFFAASFAAVGTMLTGMGLLAWSGQLTPPGSLVELVGYMIMVMFPEGFINGMGVAALVVFHPEWVETFDTDRYLQEPFDDDRRDG